MENTYIKMSKINKILGEDAVVKEFEHAIEVDTGRLAWLLKEQRGEMVEVKVVRPTETIPGERGNTAKEEEHVLKQINNRASQSCMERRAL
jgi:hypothetical protein